MTVMTMVEAIRASMQQELAFDERVMVLGQDVGRLGGVFRATDGLQAEFGDERVIDMPLAEGAIVGASIGLAAAGMVPVAEIQFLGFTQQAFHQIAGQLSRMRLRTGGALATQVVIRAPFGGGVRTPELHSDALEAFFTHCPGLKVVAPATAADAKGLLSSAVRDPDPVIFLEPLRGYRAIRDDVPGGDYTVPLGVAREVQAGDDCVIITWSAMVPVCVQAAEQVAAATGASIGVLDLRTLVPLDTDAVLAAVERAGRVVVVQESTRTSGFASEIAALVQERVFWSLEAPIARVTGFDTPYPQGALEGSWMPNVGRVARAVHRTLETEA